MEVMSDLMESCFDRAMEQRAICIGGGNSVGSKEVETINAKNS